MNAIHLADIAHHLASRDRGRRVREDVLKAIEAGGTVIIDLSEILSVSDSFADELFGVLALRGDAWFRTHIEVRGASDVVRGSIVRAIRARLERSGPGRASARETGFTLDPPPEVLR